MTATLASTAAARSRQDGEPAAAPGRQARWILSPVGDVALALCWVPFAVAAHALQTDTALLATFAAGVFLLSFAHQPLTMALVYGDREQYRLKPKVFLWAPLVLLVAVVVSYQVSFVLLALAAGAWNAEHTLMQRYGLCRIYGRKAGENGPRDGRIEKVMLFSWLLIALVFAAANPATRDHLAKVNIGRANRTGIESLLEYREIAGLLLVPLVVVAAVLVARWVMGEVRSGSKANPAKWVYVGSTAALFGVMLIDPIAGLFAYVGSHAVEYFVIVHHRLALYQGDDPVDATEPTPVGRAVRARPGRLGFLLLYAGVLVAIVSLLKVTASPPLYAAFFFTLGGMHILFDGFVWKLRRPSLARGLVGPS